MISEDLKVENEKLKMLIRKLHQEQGKEGESVDIDGSVL